MRKGDTKFRFGPKTIKGFFRGGSISKFPYFYLPFDFSDIWNNFSYGYSKGIQLGWNQNIRNWPLFFILRGRISLFWFTVRFFINFGTLVHDTITRLFKRVKTTISEKGPFFLVRESPSQNYFYLYLPFNFSEIWNKVSYRYFLRVVCIATLRVFCLNNPPLFPQQK